MFEAGARARGAVADHPLRVHPAHGSTLCVWGGRGRVGARLWRPPRCAKTAAVTARRLHRSTRLVHPHGAGHGAGSSPVIDRSSTFRLTPEADAALAAGEVAGSHDIYGRLGTRTIRDAAAVLAHVEDAPAAVPFASGTAAILATTCELVPAGGCLALAGEIYGGTQTLIGEELAARGVRVVRFDAGDPASLDAVAGGDAPPALALCETLSNPLVAPADLPGLSAVCQRRGVMLAVDSTFAAGQAARPLALGADVVIHSATKFVGGHGDVVAGFACGAPELVARLWRRMVVQGSCLDPHGAWLLARGARTLPLRWSRAQATATALAARLAAHPAVLRVFHPSRPDHPGGAPGWLEGPGAVLSFDLGSARAAAAFVAALELCVHGTSLGGLETLVCVPARSSHAPVPEADRLRAGIGPGLVRLSAGIEDVDDVWADLERALAAAEEDA